MGPPIRRRARPAASSTSSPSRASTTARRSPEACSRPSAPACCARSSRRVASLSRRARGARGGVREWLNRAVSKTVVWVTPAPRVRIPPPPPQAKCPALRGVFGSLAASLRCRRRVNRRQQTPVPALFHSPAIPPAAHHRRDGCGRACSLRDLQALNGGEVWRAPYDVAV